MTVTHPMPSTETRAGVPLRPVDLTRDDLLDVEPMPIPSTWSRTALVRHQPERFRELRWGLVGFGLGLAIIIPAVLVATGDVGPWTAGAATAPAVVAITGSSAGEAEGFATASTSPLALAFAGRRTSDRSEAAPSLVLPEPETAIQNLTITPIASATATEARRNDTNPEIVIMEARGLIAGGEIAAARALLEEARSTASGNVLFLLAETYDPAQLEAWSVQGPEPDVDKARGIYMLALLAGIETAGDRIRALEGR